MQTKEGKPAMGVTEEEFIAFLERARAAFYKKASSGHGAWLWRTGLGLPLWGNSRQSYEIVRKPANR